MGAVAGWQGGKARRQHLRSTRAACRKPAEVRRNPCAVVLNTGGHRHSVADIAVIAADPVTRDWWTRTDPFQGCCQTNANQSPFPLPCLGVRQRKGRATLRGWWRGSPTCLIGFERNRHASFASQFHHQPKHIRHQSLQTRHLSPLYTTALRSLRSSVRPSPKALRTAGPALLQKQTLIWI